MDLIVTHASADFDAFASAMAALKLYPGATVVMTSGLARGVREFASLHRDRFPWLAPADVDLAAVRRLVIVDVRRAARLRPLAPLLERVQRGELEVHVWDHHPASDDDVPAASAHVEPVGSAITLLVEAMRARGIEVDPIEATLFALGIHSDTGSMQYATTSPRDAEALAWLLARGASLRVMSRFLSVPFSRHQRAVLAAALDTMETSRVSGLRVAIAAVELDVVPEGLDEVASELFRLELPHALFVVATVPATGRASVVARAREGTFDVAAVLTSLGGGGHATAAAASPRGLDRAAILEALREGLRRAAPRPLRVCELMSSPVRTIAPDHPLARLRDELPTWGHTGVPVLRDGALVGIVSRDDIERAAREGRLHLTAGSCMSAPVHTVDAAASLEEALETMLQRRVGRLPVTRGGHVIGIVTRSDVRAVLYGEEA